MANETILEKSSEKVGVAINAIPLKTAQKWAKRWSKKEEKYNKHYELHAFLIPKADLLEVLVEGVDAVRAYIGVDDNDVEKLMIVGTKHNSENGIYEDMIAVGVGNDGTTKDNIYDFTRPCQTDCDPSSPFLV